MLDDSSLIEAVEPVWEALEIAGPAIVEQAESLKVERLDYLNDLNFLKFLVAY